MEFFDWFTGAAIAKSILLPFLGGALLCTALVEHSSAQWRPPIQVGSWNALGSGHPVHQIVVSGNHAFLANDRAGIKVIDVSDPTLPVQVGVFDTPGQAEAIVLSGNHAIVTEGDRLLVLDVTTPSDPAKGLPEAIHAV